MSVANNALKEIDAHLRGFRWLLQFDEQIREAGSLEDLVARRKQEAADLDATVTARLGAAEEAALRIVAAAEEKGRAAALAQIDAARGELAAINAEIVEAKARLAGLRNDIAGLVARFN